MKLGEESRKRLKGFLNVVLTSLGVYLGFRYILPLVLPFLFAYFLAWIIRPVTEFLFRRLRIPRIVGATFSILFLATAAGTGIYFLCNTLMRQAITLIKNIPVYVNLIAGKLDHICSHCDDMFGFVAGTARKEVDGHLIQAVDRIKTEIIPGITRQTLSYAIYFIGAIGILLIVFVSAVLIAKDLPLLKKKYEKNSFYRDVHLVTGKLAGAGIAYLRCQLIIMVMVAVFCVLGLTIIGNDYALLLGIGIAVMDAFPIMGSGIVFIPWSIILLINGNIFSAAIIMTTYLICQVIREVLEPKLIGNRIGIRPLYTLAAMYIGLKLFGFSGFFLGPVGLVIIIAIIKVINEKAGTANGQAVTFDED